MIPAVIVYLALGVMLYVAVCKQAGLWPLEPMDSVRAAIVAVLWVPVLLYAVTLVVLDAIAARWRR